MRLIRGCQKLEVAKKILAELFDIIAHEVEEMIRQRTLYGQEFSLSAT
ncbi:MAG: hypothetical protein LUQ38_01110 [Methanotrichaceae archaeon]|nr:hypothetical protein [Methanotrichaceae archaeon]MDD1758240.1 hypothetical protein [Methanotrichaceae archaeon]